MLLGCCSGETAFRWRGRSPHFHTSHTLHGRDPIGPFLCADDHRSARVMPPSPAARGCDEWSRGGCRRRASLSTTAMRGPSSAVVLGQVGTSGETGALGGQDRCERRNQNPKQSAGGCTTRRHKLSKNSRCIQATRSRPGATVLWQALYPRARTRSIPANLRGQSAAKTLRSSQKRRRPPLPATSTPTFVLD